MCETKILALHFIGLTLFQKWPFCAYFSQTESISCRLTTRTTWFKQIGGCVVGPWELKERGEIITVLKFETWNTFSSIIVGGGSTIWVNVKTFFFMPNVDIHKDTFLTWLLLPLRSVTFVQIIVSLTGMQLLSLMQPTYISSTARYVNKLLL